MQRRKRKIEDGLGLISSTSVSFMEAIADLTEVTELKDPVYKSDSTLHVYIIPGSGGVYVTHAKINNGDNIRDLATEAPNLKPEFFKDEAYLADFKEKAKSLEDSSVYLVTNPSRRIPPQMLSLQGLNHHAVKLEEYNEEKRQKADSLFQSLKQAYSKLKGE